MIFIDLSGFTALSERLARLGREGAEEVTRVINTTFTDLLDVSYRAGGSLLKFGGDALLLLFQGGDDHAARACAAAHGMRARLRACGPIPTAGGVARLQMTVGVHTGTFDLFLVGGSHRELLIAGPATSTVVTMEAAAHAGQVVISPEVAAALPRSCVGRQTGPGFLLAGPPDVAEMPIVVGAAGDPVPFVPAALRQLLEGDDAQPPAEHRHAAVGFVHIDGLDALVGTDGEAAAAALQTVVAAAQDAAALHGVCLLASDIDHDGAKLIFTAGVPTTVGDDEERLVRAVKQLVDGDHGLPLRAGVHCGSLFAGVVGPTYRRTYTVMGDVVNTSARVMARARPRELLVTSPVLARCRSRFVTEAVEPFAAKGKAAPIEAHLVRATEGADLVAPASGPLVGRDSEQQELLARWRRTEAGDGSAVEVVGEAGIGKSRLVAELLATATSADVVRLRGEPHLAAAAWAPFRPLLRDVVGLARDHTDDRSAARLQRRLALLAPELVPDTPLLAAVMGIDASTEAPDLDNRLWQSRLHEAVARLLRVAYPGRTLFVIEDAHWLDHASATLVRDLGGRASGTRWLLVVVRRPEGPGLAPGTIHLGPLAPVDAEVAVRTLSTRPLLPDQVALLASRSGGSPLLLHELVAAFDPDASADEVSVGVEGLISARIDRLSPAHRNALRRVAVLGGTFPTEATAVVGTTTDALGELGDFLTEEGGQVSFRQSLFRDVAYRGLPFAERRRLHAEVAAWWLEGGAGHDRPELLSFHLYAAGDRDGAWHWSYRAGVQAKERRAFHDAITLLQRAVASARGSSSVDVPELAAAWQALGQSLFSAGRTDDAVRPLARARRLRAGQPDALARLCLLEGSVRERQGQLVAALRWYRRGRRHLEGRDLTHGEAVDRVRLLTAAGAVRHQQGRYRDAVAELEQALSEAEAIDDRPGIAHACNWLQLTLTHLRDERGETYGRRAVDLYGAVGAPWMQAQALNSLALAARAFGRWNDAVALFRECRQRLDDARDVLGIAVVDNNLGELLCDQGRLEEADTAFAGAESTFAAAGHVYAAAVRGHRARIALRRGDLADALPRFEQAEAELARAGLGALAAENRLRRAEALALAGRIEEAAALLESLPADLGPDLVPQRHRIGGVVALESGDKAAALACFERARAAGDANHDPFEVAYACLHLAAADPKGHGHRARQAAATFDALGVVTPPPLTHIVDIRTAPLSSLAPIPSPS